MQYKVEPVFTELQNIFLFASFDHTGSMHLSLSGYCSGIRELSHWFRLSYTVLLYVFQGPCCHVCDATFVSTSAVLEHLHDVHPSAILASFVTSSKGNSMLVHHEYVYVCNYKPVSGRTYHWMCKKAGCRARAATRGRTCDDVTSIVIKVANEHNHAPASVDIRLYDAMERLRQQALQTNVFPMTLRLQLLASVDPEVAAILPSKGAMARCINRWRLRKKQAEKAECDEASSGDAQK